MKRMLLATSTAIVLFAPATDVSAQYRYFDHQFPDRHRYHRPIAAKPLRAPKADVMAARTTGAAVNKPAAQTHKPAPVAPLSAEQLAAKAAVDELLAREPALAAAKERPDPRLAREAAAKHSAQEKQLAALQAKQQAAAGKRRESADKIKAREDAKAAAIKQQTQSKAKKANADANGTRSDRRRLPTAVAAAPARAVPRMPVP